MTPTSVVFSSCIPDGRIQAGSICLSALLSSKTKPKAMLKAKITSTIPNKNESVPPITCAMAPFGSWPRVTA